MQKELCQPPPGRRFSIRAFVSCFSANCAEGADAASLAALIKERERLQSRRVAVILSGQNIDRAWMQTVLAGATPRLDDQGEPPQDL